MKATKKFKELLKKEETIILPGAFNALSAKYVEKLGFEAVYTTGAGITNAMMGFPDVGLQSFYEIFHQIRYIVNAVNIPVISDIDTGFGNVLNAMRTTSEIEKIGVAGIQIEDQIFPKKCGHFSGKKIISKNEMAKKIEAIIDNRMDPDFTIIARTDAIATDGISEAIERGKLYKSVGADIIFIEAPRTIDEMKRIVDEVEGDKIINIVEGALTPQLDVETLSKMGYKIILFPTTTLRASAMGVKTVLELLKKGNYANEIKKKIISWEERGEITNLACYYELEKKYLD